jgi:Zn-dependent metalloprotease
VQCSEGRASGPIQVFPAWPRTGLSMSNPALLTLMIGICTLACAASAPSQTQSDAASRALAYVRAQASALGVAPADLADLVVTSETVSPRTRVIHVYVRQRFRGIEIVGGDITVAIAPDGTITHQAGSIVANVAAAANRPRSTLGKPEAVARAASHVNVAPPDVERKTRPAMLMYHPVARDRLRLAWQVEIETLDGDHHWVVTVDAVSGALLDKFDRIASNEENVDE